MEIIEQTQDFLEKREIIINVLKDQLPKVLGESEHSPVLIGVTRLENELEKYITSFLIESPTGIDDLFETGPLSTFSAKISVARRLGLINNELQAAIDNMRKIRNMVNKSAGKHIFESEQVTLMINSMYKNYYKNRNFKDIGNKLAELEMFIMLKRNNENTANYILILYYLIYTLQTGKLLAEKKQYRAKRVLSFP